MPGKVTLRRIHPTKPETVIPPNEDADGAEADLRCQLESESSAFDLERAKLAAQIREADESFESARIIREEARKSLQRRAAAEKARLDAHELSARPAMNNPSDSDHIELASELSALESSLQETRASIESVQNALDVITEQRQTLELLVKAIPFANEELESLARRQLSLSCKNAVFQVEQESAAVEEELQQLRDELRLVNEISARVKNENKLLVSKIKRAQEFEAEIRSAFVQITDDEESGTDGISSADLAKLLDGMDVNRKRELKLLEREFERRIRSLEPSPADLQSELDGKSKVTELLNTRLSQLVSEVEQIHANAAAAIHKLKEKHRSEVGDIRCRAQAKLEQLLDDQVSSFHQSRSS
jgi:predicted  nucleic acid-binding Zn-ribbon protein